MKESSDRFHITHFSSDHVKGAKELSDRLHETQKCVRNTAILKDHRNIINVKKKGHEFSYTSPRVTGKDSEYCWDDTFGEKCHWSPHPDQHPGTHDKLHEVFPTHFGDTQIKFTLASADFKQVTHLNGENMGRVHCNSERLHGFPVTHFGGDNVKEARYGSDRLRGEQTDTSNTTRKLGDRFLEVLVAETVQRKETRLKDYKSILEDQKT